MRKSIYLIELCIYGALGVLLGLVMGLSTESWPYFAAGIAGPLFWYFIYLVSVQMLVSSYGPGSSRIIGVIAVSLVTAGGWLVFFVPGEFIRRLALTIYEGERPVETLLGTVSAAGQCPAAGESGARSSPDKSGNKGE